MRIGITYNLRKSGPLPDDVPDDHQEEFDSPRTIASLAAAIRSLGHDVVRLGDGRAFLKKILASKPDLVFNYAEGTGVSRNREARVPAVLEMLGIPYTGSDPLTMAATLDKDVGKTLVAAAGVNVPGGCALGPDDRLDDGVIAKLKFPVVVKPAWEGSSKGIRAKSFVSKPGELGRVVASLRRDYGQTLLIEDFIDGDEITVGVHGNGLGAKVLGIMRIKPRDTSKPFLYSLETKRNYEKLLIYEKKASLPVAIESAVEDAALSAYRALGCRDIARLDFRLRNGVPYFLEANPLPGMSPVSGDLIWLSEGQGWSYRQLVAAILDAAIARLGLVRP
jgi:D-alanine-D-alanine ligase